MSQQQASTGDFFKIGKFFRGLATVTRTIMIAPAGGAGVYFLMLVITIAIEASRGYSGSLMFLGYFAYTGLFGGCGVSFFGTILIFVWVRKLAEIIKITGGSKHIDLFHAFAKYLNVSFTLGLVFLSYEIVMGFSFFTNLGYISSYYAMILEQAGLMESFFIPPVVLGLIGYPFAYKNWKKLNAFFGDINGTTIRQAAEDGLKKVRASHVTGFIASCLGIYFVIMPGILVYAASFYNFYFIYNSAYESLILALLEANLIFIGIFTIFGIIGGTTTVKGFYKIGTAFQGIDEQAFNLAAGLESHAIALHRTETGELPAVSRLIQGSTGLTPSSTSWQVESRRNVYESRGKLASDELPYQQATEIVPDSIPRFCPGCGANLPGVTDLEYCPYCGHKLS